MSARPAIAIIQNSLTPYRLHYHTRIVREMPEVSLWSIFTHGESNSPWGQAAPAEIGPVEFGPGEPSVRQADPGRAWHEWRKGGRICRWLRAAGVRAVVLGGYDDPGRVRILNWCHRRGIPLFLWG